MSVRLQVLLAEDEMNEVRAAAERERVTVAEWVRDALRNAMEAHGIRRVLSFDRDFDRCDWLTRLG